jgi:arginyl-tRNA synthetase
MGQGRKVNVEFVSANPTGPLHVGHTRGAVFGDALASLLDFAGYDVTREYYINDGGAQVDVLARSVYLRYLEAHGQEVAFEDGTYPGDYLIPVGEALKDKVGDAYVDQPEGVWLAEVREFATDAMMALIREDLARSAWRWTSSSPKIALRHGPDRGGARRSGGKGLIYEGVLEPPKGKTPEDWEPREQTLFKSTAHGDDVDRPVMKSDGVLDLFRPRHRLSLRQGQPGLRRADRRLRRRSWRLRQADEGGRRGAVGRARAARHQADAAGEAQQATASPSRCPSARAPS